MANYTKEKIIFCDVDKIKSWVSDFKNVLFVGNYFPENKFNFQTISIPNGEDAKTLKVCEILWSLFEKMKVDRNSLVVSVGGGSASDAVGFAASTYLRGVHFASIPTTLLSMIDASVGGKRAINTDTAKNQIGSFYNAESIFIDTNFLETLSDVEIKCGICEAIKISLLCDFSIDSDWQSLIKKCIESKQSIVESDFKDNNGKRQILNYGHTLAHVLEVLFDYKIPHGIGVAVGMDFAAYMTGNNKINNIQKELFDNYNLDGYINDIKKNLKNIDIEKVLTIVKKDKKIKDDVLNFVYLDNIGCAKISKITLNNFKSSLLKYVL